MATNFEGTKEHAITFKNAAAIADPRSSGRGATLPGPQWSEGERSETERSEGAGNVEGETGTPRPADPEVAADRPSRRRFTAEYKRRVLREVDACSRGEVAALLRREGLYSSHLAGWRQERERGEMTALSGKKRGPQRTQPDPAVLAENKRLRRENQRLERRLRQAEFCLEIQKKASEILGIPLNPPEFDEND